jgi:2-methylcitrate dehydratase PrpD
MNILVIMISRNILKTSYISDILAEYIADIQFQKLPNSVIEHTKICVLDCIGSALIGFTEGDGQTFAEFAYQIGAKGRSTIIGSGLKTHSLNAALANAFLSHLCEMDDIISLVHMEGVVVPTTLSVGEQLDLSGKDLILSIVTGYDIGSRISKAVNYHDRYKFWHPTGTIGTFAAAATTAKLLNLSKRKIINSFGLAGTQAAGLMATWGTSGKSLNSAKAAYNGLLASLLSQKGLSGPPDIFESNRGFCIATSSSYDFTDVLNDLGRRYEILENTFKIHASCGGIHPAIDAVLQLKKDHDFQSDEIEKVNVITSSTVEQLLGHTYHPSTPSKARFSLPYCLALAFMEDEVNISGFTKKKLSNLKIRKIAEKIKVTSSTKFDDYWKKNLMTAAEVTIHSKSGKMFRILIDTPKGNPKNPVTKIEIQKKFRSLSSSIIQSERISKIISLVDKLEDIKIQDLMELVQK